MKLLAFLATFLGLGLCCALPGVAQEQGSWRPASKTAQSITGNVVFGGDKMSINFFSTTVAQIRPLKPDEIVAAFNGGDASGGAGHLYRLSIPGNRRLLHKNTLCGSEETQWLATFVSGKSLQIAFFSNAAPPVFTVEALGNSPNLCGTFSYMR